jgi:hypothetical protein
VSAIHILDGDRAKTMMRAKFCFTTPFKFRVAAAFAMGLWFFSMPGCALMSSSSAPSRGTEMLPTPPEAAAVANAQSQQPSTDKDDDKDLKCEQLVRNPPGIEEIRRTPELGIESREIRVERTPESYRWVVYRSKGSAPDGWRAQNALDKLHFNPALQYLLPDKTPQYLAYAPSVPETPQDSEQMMSIADNFGQKVGTFEWGGKYYTYTISKNLPCFKEPEE